MVQERGCLDSLAGVFMALALFTFALTVLVLIALIFAAAIGLFLVLRHLTRRYVWPQFYPATAVFAEQRLFDAPPDSQLFSAFDYWLACLEAATGRTFTETPGQLMAGSIIISLAPAMVVGLPLAVFNPSLGSWLLPGSLVFALLFGGFTGHRLGAPAGGWFDGGGPMTPAEPVARRDGFELGEEDW